ncbi:MAG TPA: glycosyltransferase family 87 protein, partial [Isosphaeraceae bacterium]|nr:glycosyltransferase family 87 protein [Isosphaeraceae bacterium]
GPGMSDRDYPAYDPLAALVVLATLAISLGWSPSVRVIRSITLIGLSGALLLMYLKYVIPYDFKLFRIAGLDLWKGLNVYQPHDGPDSQRPLNPPTAWPLFELFACSSLRHSARVWSVLNALGSLLLVPLAARALQAQDASAPLPSRPVLGLLSAAVALSNATCSGLALGQLSLLGSLAIFAALWAHGASRPGLAGMFLALATPKPATLLPFLLLFGRRKDLPVWVSLSATSLCLILASGQAAEVPARLRDNLLLIAQMAAPGQVNDYSYAGESHLSLIGFDHALFRLGLRDRGIIRALNGLLTLTLSVAVARLVLSRRFERSAKCSIVSIFALLFLYHRVYDAVLLALPLVFVVGQAQARCPGRYAFAASAAALLAVLFAFPELFRPLEHWAFAHPRLGWVVEALVLPSATWLALGALAACGLGVRAQSRRDHPLLSTSRSTSLMRLAKTSRPNRAAWFRPFSIHEAR